MYIRINSNKIDPAIKGFFPKQANSIPTVPLPVITLSQILIKFLVLISSLGQYNHIF